MKISKGASVSVNGTEPVIGGEFGGFWLWVCINKEKNVGPEAMKASWPPSIHNHLDFILILLIRFGFNRTNERRHIRIFFSNSLSSSVLWKFYVKCFWQNRQCEERDVFLEVKSNNPNYSHEPKDKYEHNVCHSNKNIKEGSIPWMTFTDQR